MPFSQIATSVNIFSSGLVGYYAISFTEWVDGVSTPPIMAAGSAIEIAGAFFHATEDIYFPAATSIVPTIHYMQLVPSGIAGNQILTASITTATPVWSISKQGWYASAASNIRVIGRFSHNTTGSSKYSARTILANMPFPIYFSFTDGIHAEGRNAGIYGKGAAYGVYGVGGASAAAGVYGAAGGGAYGVWGSSGDAAAVYGSGSVNGVQGNGSTWDFYASGAGGNYGPFTGAHEVLIKGMAPEIGMIMSCTGKVIKREYTISATIPECIITAKEKDAAVFGVFTRLFNLPEDHWCEDRTKQLGICNALGDGQVLVTNKNGNISCGDYITTSEIAGYGEKQDDDLIHSYTLGKCTETIEWDTITTTKEIDGITYKACLIACIYVSA